MRRVVVLLLLAVAGATGAFAEVTSTLRVELAGSPSSLFVVENLAGVMRVTAGDGAAVVAVATVHAENEALAGEVRFEQVTGKEGEPVLRVRYPESHSTFRYPQAGNSTLKYDGRMVRVSSSRGVELWADVEVTVPRTAVHGAFRNHVGKLSGSGLKGRVAFDSGSGDIELRTLDGEVSADTGSGDILASEIRGAFSGDTGSGDIGLKGFSGESVTCDTGSGDVHVEAVTARTVKADTGSGSVRVVGADIESLAADTGSGSVVLEATGGRLRRVKADTGSGDVRLRLPADAGFEVRADQGSGDLVCRFDDARAIVSGRTVVGYTRGDGRIRIAADTGSGDVIVEPPAAAEKR